MIRRACRDDAAWIEHRAAVRAAARRRLGRDAVDDVEQEVWLRALAATTVPAEPRRLRHWLLAVAGNVCADELRRRYRRRVAPLTGAEPARDLSSLRQDVEDVLSVLSPDQRTLLELRHGHGGCSVAELAARWGTTCASVSQRLFRARRTVREHAARNRVVRLA